MIGWCTAEFVSGNAFFLNCCPDRSRRIAVYVKCSELCADFVCKRPESWDLLRSVPTNGIPKEGVRVVGAGAAGSLGIV